MRALTQSLVAIAFFTPALAHAQPIETEGQPLAENVKRVVRAFDDLGYPLNPDTVTALQKAANAQDGKRLQELLDGHVLVFIHVNPEARVKAKRGDGAANLQQAGYTPHLVKV